MVMKVTTVRRPNIGKMSNKPIGIISTRNNSLGINTISFISKRPILMNISPNNVHKLVKYTGLRLIFLCALNILNFKIFVILKITSKRYQKVENN